MLMGVNDAAEMLEVAKEEVGRLEAEVATLRAEKDSPHADAKYWVELQAARNEIARLNGQTFPLDPPAWLVTERDAALAAIQRVLNLTGDIGSEARRILTLTPLDALQKHNARLVTEFMDQPEFKAMLAAVKASALEEAASDLPFIDRPKNMIVRQQDAAHWLRTRAAECRKAGE